ncbi:MAG: cupin domain-containing protein [Methanomassiliicoccales archaeon]|jgi:quercetin dioxygenase-like cupin family protein|nr:cupin domain-containing protein [Methanomassiliicoccales archaeon]
MAFKCVDHRDVKQEDVKEEGAKGAKIRWLITKEDGAEKFAMRHFEVAVSGSSPLHQHPYEHEVFVLKGKCEIFCGGKTETVGEGGVIFVPPNVVHQFRNVGQTTLEFLCMIPYTD